VDNEPLVRNWQAAIVGDCKRILGRRLTDDETAFITSREAFVALEAIRDHVQSLVDRPEELERYLRSEVPAAVEIEHAYTRYRPSWIAIFRQKSIATAFRYAVFAAIALSLLGVVPRPPTQFLALALALISLAAHIVIRCPRCRAWWPLGSEDDGQRKPCAQCGLRWGQEDESPEG